MQFSSKDIQLFNESGIHVEDKNYTNDEVERLKKLTDTEIEEIIFPLTPHQSQLGFRNILIKEWKQYALNWQPFGSDSLVTY